jgi:hypothetical protein
MLLSSRVPQIRDPNEHEPESADSTLSIFLMQPAFH